MASAAILAQVHCTIACSLLVFGAMAADRPPTPKAGGPAWLRNTGVRVDEFARQARLSTLPAPPGDPAEGTGDVSRRRLLEEAGSGLKYKATAKTAPHSAAAGHTLALTHSVAASFSPQRHVFYVLGRPCVVLRDIIVITIFNACLSLHSSANCRNAWSIAIMQSSITTRQNVRD